MRIFKHSTSDSRNWLLNGGKNVEPTTKCPGFEHFEQMNKSTSGWLKGEHGSFKSMKPNITSEDFREKSSEADQQTWLHPNTSYDDKVYVTASNTWQKVVDQHNQISEDQWLLSKVNVRKNHRVYELDNEQWLLKKEEMECETPTKENAIEFPALDDCQWLLQ